MVEFNAANILGKPRFWPTQTMSDEEVQEFVRDSIILNKANPGYWVWIVGSCGQFVFREIAGFFPPREEPKDEEERIESYISGTIEVVPLQVQSYEES